MGIHRKKLDRLCTCGAEMIEVSMKNPFLDDSAVECLGDVNKCENAYVALPLLWAAARTEARRQEAMDREPIADETEADQ